MLKIMLIPCNDMQVNIYSNILNALSELIEFEPLYLCIDVYKNENSIKSLVGRNQPYKRIEDFSGKCPKHILQVEKPDVLILTNDCDPFIRRFIDEASMRGIATIMVQDGMISPNVLRSGSIFSMLKQLKSKTAYLFKKIVHGEYNLIAKAYLFRLILIDRLRGEPFVIGLGNCDLMLVSGPHYKLLLASQGANPSKIRCVGQPKFDVFDDYMPLPKSASLKVSRKTVIFASQPLLSYGIWTKNQFVDFWTSVVSLFATNPEINFIIKLHPREDIDEYNTFFRKTFDNINVMKDVDMKSLIKVSDVVITYYSTVALEAMIMGKPVVCADFYSQFDIPFTDGGAAITVYDVDELSKVIERLINDEKTFRNQVENGHRYVKDHLGPLDGRSSERAAKAIDELLRSKKKICA